MRLLIVRHGRAVEAAEARELGDPGRWLTAKGRRRSRRAFREIVRARGGFRPAEIWTSPLVRAVQTAEVLAEVAGLEGGVRVAAELAPGREADLVGRLATRIGTSRGALALVGHEPGLGGLARVLLGRPAFPLEKSGAIALEIESEGAGRFVFQLGPRKPLVFREDPPG